MVNPCRIWRMNEAAHPQPETLLATSCGGWRCHLKSVRARRGLHYPRQGGAVALSNGRGNQSFSGDRVTLKGIADEPTCCFPNGSDSSPMTGDCRMRTSKASLFNGAAIPARALITGILLHARASWASHGKEGEPRADPAWPQNSQS